MRLLDTTKVACHSILNNKSRSILTVIIVAIVSALMMFIVSLGLVFNDYQLKGNREVFNQEGNTFNIYPIYDSSSQQLVEVPCIDKADLEQLDNLILKYDHIINNVSYKINSDCCLNIGDNDYRYNRISDMTVAIDPANFIVNSNNFILDGRLWNKDDKSKNNVWLSMDYIISLSKRNINISVGDEINIIRYGDTINTINDYQNVCNVRVAGIYDKSALPKDNHWFNNADMIIDYNTLINTLNGVVVDVTISYFPPVGINYDFNSIYNDLSKFNTELTNLFPSYISDGYERERIYSNFYSTMEMSILMGYVIIALAIFLAFIVLLLSIGSVANTIIISVDKNRKFIGLMKALGLNQKGVKKLVHIEAFITILVGILLGGLLLFATNGILEVIIQTLINQLFSYNDIKLDVVVSFNYLLPLVVFVIFYLFALLFSKGSLKKISSQDVIETISEVA